MPVCPPGEAGENRENRTGERLEQRFERARHSVEGLQEATGGAVSSPGRPGHAIVERDRYGWPSFDRKVDRLPRRRHGQISVDPP